MASRLSDVALKERHDSGFRSLSWLAPERGANLLRIDIERLISDPNAPELIRSMPPQMLYHAIKLSGLERSAQVIRHLSSEQLTRMLDYDAWPRDQLEPKRAFSWLLAFKDLGEHELYRRYRDLEEEYQIALIEKYVQLIDLEQYDALPEPQRQMFSVFPGEELYYRITADDPEIVEFLNDLVASCQSGSMNYAMSLLAHATYMPPNESMLLLHQFRKARLEEDGFVDYLESLAVFRPADPDQLRQKWQADHPDGVEVISGYRQESDEVCFLEYVIDRAASRGLWQVDNGIELQQKLLYLANAVCSASRVEPDDVDGLNMVLEHIRALVSLGLEYVSGGDDALALMILRSEHPKLLFRSALGMCRKLQSHVVDMMLKDLPEVGRRMQIYWRQHKYAELLDIIDKHVLPDSCRFDQEVLRALFNRFPMMVATDNADLKVTFKPIDSLEGLRRLERVFLAQ